MKIGIFDPYLDTLTGGERYMLSIASCLARTNSVTLFWEERGILPKAMEKLGIDLNSVSISKNILYLPIFEKLVSTSKYDALIVLSDGSIPVVASNLYLHFQHPMEGVHVSLKDYLKIKRAKKVICNSLFTKKYIDKKFHVKSVVLYPPVGVDRYNIEKKTDRIVTVGRFSLLPNGTDFKKQSVLIEEFKKVREYFPHLKLTVVTSTIPSEKRALEEFIQKHKQEGVEFLISPTFSEFKNVYSTAKIYWHATGFGEDIEKNPERAEHFGITTVEAMSAGAVPVVYNEGGQKEIVHQNVNGLLWNNTQELVEMTKKVLEDKIFFEKLSKEAIKSSKKFSEDAFCKNLSEIISVT